jgi:DNA topoisomerase-2
MGKIERVDDETILITELPVKKWTQDYKEFLEAMMETPKEKPDLKDMRENHTEMSISFTLIADKEKIDAWEQEKNGLYAKFKLSSSISSSNMMLYDTNQRITKYDTPEDIMNAFYEVRLEYYVKRKANLVRNLEAERKMLSNKARFVEEVCAGDLIVSNRKRAEILAELQERGYDLITKDGKNDPENSEDQEIEDEEETSISELVKGYEYLLGMKIWSLTYEKAEELRSQLQAKTQELKMLQATSPEQIWLNDLDAIGEGLNQRDAEFRAAEEDERRAKKKSQKYQKAKSTKSKGASKKTKEAWDSEAEESDEDPMDMSDSEDELFAQVKKPAPKPTARAALMKKATVKAQQPKPCEVSKVTIFPYQKAAPKDAGNPETSDGDNDEMIPLSQRLQNKLLVSPPEKMNKKNRDSNSSSGTKSSKKRPSPKNIDSDQDDEIEVFMATEKPKAVKAKRSTAKPKPAAKNNPGKKKALPKKKVDLSDSEDSDELDFQSSEDEKATRPVARAPRRAAAATKTTYTFEDSSSGEGSDFDDV